MEKHERIGEKSLQCAFKVLPGLIEVLYIKLYTDNDDTHLVFIMSVFKTDSVFLSVFYTCQFKKRGQFLKRTKKTDDLGKPPNGL